MLTSSSSSVPSLGVPVLERGAPDTGVTRHAELLSTKSMQTLSPRQSLGKGKRNSIVYFLFFSCEEYFYSLAVSCVYYYAS